MVTSATLPLGSCAAVPPQEAAPTTHAQPRLIAEHDALVPGTTVTLALTFTIAKPWHLYWPGVVEEGMTPEWTLSLPAGYEVGAAQWPAPHRLILPGDLLQHVYEHALTVLIPVRVPAAAKAGDAVTISGTLTWFACGEICVPEEGTVSLALPVRSEAKPSADAAVIAKARAVLPADVAKATPPIKVVVEAGVLRVSAPGASRLTFVPGRGCVETPSLLKQGDRKGEALAIDLEQADAGRVVGLVLVERPGQSPASYTIDLTVPPPPKADD